MGALEQVQILENILKDSERQLESCQQMQNNASTQVGLEVEILSKVEEQYTMLKGIIDEQKLKAQNIIKNLESVQNYKPPPQDFTGETLQQVQAFSAEVQEAIQNFKELVAGGQHLEILKQKTISNILQDKMQAMAKRIDQHKTFFNENSRP